MTRIRSRQQGCVATARSTRASTSFADRFQDAAEAVLEVREMALEGGLVDLGTLQKDRQGDIGVAAFEAEVEQSPPDAGPL